jgi:hypothetical protein
VRVVNRASAALTLLHSPSALKRPLSPTGEKGFELTLAGSFYRWTRPVPEPCIKASISGLVA